MTQGSSVKRKVRHRECLCLYVTSTSRKSCNTDSSVPSQVCILLYTDIMPCDNSSPAVPDMLRIASCSRKQRQRQRLLQRAEQTPTKRISWALACCYTKGQAASLAVREFSATLGKQAC